MVSHQSSHLAVITLLDMCNTIHLLQVPCADEMKLMRMYHPDLPCGESSSGWQTFSPPHSFMKLMRWVPLRPDLIAKGSVGGATGSWLPRDSTTCADLEWPVLKEVRVWGLAGHVNKASFEFETLDTVEQPVESKTPAVVSGVSVEPHEVRNWPWPDA